MTIAINEVLDGLTFGVTADRFEQAFDNLGKSLGFTSERPDKEWKAGPDNLWCLRKGYYLVAECKSEVSADRKEINKGETGQMNNACGWFERNYRGAEYVSRLIIPAGQVSTAAAFTGPTTLLRSRKLGVLRKNVRLFFNDFQGKDLSDVPTRLINLGLQDHKLLVEDIVDDYADKPRVY